MKVPEVVAEFVAGQGWGAVTHAHPVAGGCINDGHVLGTAGGPRLFLKLNASAPLDMFAREAEGLTALAVEGGPRVPRPLLVGTPYLLLEYLAPEPLEQAYWERLGVRLAHLHAVTQTRFGFPHDNYIGSTPQPNGWLNDGFEFFAERRLRFQGRLARERGLLSQVDVHRLERVAAKLRDLIPEQPASLIHGDLWGGNVIAGPGGQACLIDPAAHYGWAEADLAMTTLFGRFPDSFYASYEAYRPLAPGFRSRADLYNLYHLLNHLNLFGAGYHQSVEPILAQYS